MGIKHHFKVIRPRERLRLDIDAFFTPVILTTKYTKSMSDLLKSELKLLFGKKAHFSAKYHINTFLNLYFFACCKYKHNAKQLLKI